MYFPLPVSGVTPLHIAVVNQNLNLVQHLINRGGDVATPRVTGLYFRKRIGGLIYYGKQAGSMATDAAENIQTTVAGNKKRFFVFVLFFIHK